MESVYMCVTVGTRVCLCACVCMHVSVCTQGIHGHDFMPMCMSVYAHVCMGDECMCVHKACLGEGQGSRGSSGYIVVKLLVYLWASK